MLNEATIQTAIKQYLDVLILIIMEYAQWEIYDRRRSNEIFVLILIVMEYA